MVVALGEPTPASNRVGTFFPVARLVKIIASHSKGLLHLHIWHVAATPDSAHVRPDGKNHATERPHAPKPAVIYCRRVTDLNDTPSLVPLSFSLRRGRSTSTESVQ